MNLANENLTSLIYTTPDCDTNTKINELNNLYKIISKGQKYKEDISGDEIYMEEYTSLNIDEDVKSVLISNVSNEWTVEKLCK